MRHADPEQLERHSIQEIGSTNSQKGKKGRGENQSLHKSLEDEKGHADQGGVHHVLTH